jgi:hypothetical protein
MAEKVDILINAKNNASRELNQVSGDLQRLNQTSLRMSAISKGMGLVGAVVGTAATVGVIAKTTVELARMAGAFSTLKNSFDELAAGVGANADDMLSALRTASNGMINDMSLVQSANRALLLGVADSAGEMTQLLQVAMVRGQAMGLSAEQAFNDIVTGIGRMSPLILDNLGIVTGGEKVFNDYAEAIGKAADELTDAEKKQALLNSVVASSAGIVETAADSAVGGFERLKTSIDNAKLSLGLLFSEDFNQAASEAAGTIDMLIAKFLEFDNMLRDDYNRMNFGDLDATEKNLESVMRMIMDTKVIMDDVSNQLINAAIANDATKFENIKMQIDGLGMSFESLGKQYNEIAVQLGKQVLNIDQLRNGILYYEDYVSSAEEAADAMDDLNEASGNAKRVLTDLVPLGSEAGGSFNEAAIALAILNVNAGQAQSTLAALARSLVTSKSEALNFAGAVGAAFDTMSEIAGDRSGAKFGALSGLITTPLQIGDGMKAVALESGPAKAGVAAVNSEFESLKSTISGIVSGAIGPVAGVDANDLLPREDAVNENARRLADIAVNGFKGQEWLDEFAMEAPDVFEQLKNSSDPKATAAQILKDFQDGLRPDLLDKDRAKELVKRALQGDANTKQLVDEIAGELASELGISLGEAKATASEVLGGGEGATGVSLAPKIDTSAAASAAGAFAAAFNTAITDSSMGADLSGAIMTQVMASVAVIESSGNEAGKALVKGVTATFTDIPAAFIAAVASLVTPAVQASINSNGGRTGAAAV